VEILVCYSFRETDEDIFTGVDNAGTLVYDGGITINHKFETPDPCIKAAGSATVYARRFYAENEVQGRYSSSEIGERLANTVVREFSSGGSFWDRPDSVSTSTNPWRDTTGVLPMMKKPIETKCSLLNGISFLHVRTANKRYSDAEIAEILKEAGTFDLKNKQKKSFSTGSIDDPKSEKTKGYFYLGFDLNSRLSEILCLTGDSASKARLNSFKNLHGIHISYLNNLVERFRDETMLDLYDFFEDPWAYALLDHKYQDFRARREADTNSQNEEWNKLAVENLLSPLSYDRLLSSSEISTLTRPLRDFLLNCKSMLPMFAGPDTLFCRLAPKIDKKYIGFLPILNAKITKHEKHHSANTSANQGSDSEIRHPDESDEDSDNEDSSSKPKTSSFLYALRQNRKIETLRRSMKIQLRYGRGTIPFRPSL